MNYEIIKVADWQPGEESDIEPLNDRQDAIRTRRYGDPFSVESPAEALLGIS